jgi:hypothetical protein
MDLLVETLQDLSQSTVGSAHGLEIELFDPPPPSLAWAVREYDAFFVQSDLNGFGAPVVLAQEREGEIQLPAEYIGQSITIGEAWGWDPPVPNDLLAWWVRREAPTRFIRWLILVREDVALLDRGGTGGF